MKAFLPLLALILAPAAAYGYGISYGGLKPIRARPSPSKWQRNTQWVDVYCGAAPERSYGERRVCFNIKGDINKRIKHPKNLAGYYSDDGSRFVILPGQDAVTFSTSSQDVVITPQYNACCDYTVNPNDVDLCPSLVRATLLRTSVQETPRSFRWSRNRPAQQRRIILILRSLHVNIPLAVARLLL